MSEILNSRAKERFLSSAFKPGEMKYLNQDPCFQKAMEDMNSFNDFEKVTALGQYLLDKGDAVIREALSLRPKSRPDPLPPSPSPPSQA